MSQIRPERPPRRAGDELTMSLLITDKSQMSHAMRRSRLLSDKKRRIAWTLGGRVRRRTSTRKNSMIITMPLSYSQASSLNVQQQLETIQSQLVTSASSPLPLPDPQRPPTLRSQASKQTIRRKPVPYKSQEEMRATSRSVESLSLRQEPGKMQAGSLRQSRSFDVSIISPRDNRHNRWSTESERAESLEDEELVQEVIMRSQGRSTLPTPALSSTQSSLQYSLSNQLSPSSSHTNAHAGLVSLITPPPSAPSFQTRRQKLPAIVTSTSSDHLVLREPQSAVFADFAPNPTAPGDDARRRGIEEEDSEADRLKDAAYERIGYWDYSIVSLVTLQPSTHEPMPTLNLPPLGPTKPKLRSARRKNISRGLIRSQSLQDASHGGMPPRDLSTTPAPEAFQDVSESDQAGSTNGLDQLDTEAPASEEQSKAADKRSTNSSWEAQTSRLVAAGSSPDGSMLSKDTDLADFEIASTVELPSDPDLPQDARSKPFQPVFHFPSPPTSNRDSSVPSVFSHRLSDSSSRHVRKPVARASIASVLSRTKHATFGQRQCGSLFDGLDEIGKAISETGRQSASPASSHRSTILLEAISRAISLPSLASLNKALPPLPQEEALEMHELAEPDPIYTGIALSTDNLLPVPSRIRSSASFARRSRLHPSLQRRSRASRSLLKTKRSFVIEGNDILDNPIEMVALDRPTVTFTATPEDFARFEQGAQAPTRLSWRGVLAGCFRFC